MEDIDIQLEQALKILSRYVNELKRDPRDKRTRVAVCRGLREARLRYRELCRWFGGGYGEAGRELLNLAEEAVGVLPKARTASAVVRVIRRYEREIKKDIDQFNLSNQIPVAGHIRQLSIFNVRSMIRSQLQNASPFAGQTLSLGRDARKQIGQLIDTMRSRTENLTLSIVQKGDLLAQIETMRAQMGCSRPNAEIVEDCLEGVKEILESAGRDSVAGDLRRQVDSIFGLLWTSI